MAGEWEKLNEKVRAKKTKNDPPFKVLKNHRRSQSQQQFTGCIQAAAIEMKGRFPFSSKFRKVVHFDRPGHFGRSDRIVPFHFDKIVFPQEYPSFVSSLQGQ